LNNELNVGPETQDNGYKTYRVTLGFNPGESSSGNQESRIK